MTHTKRHNRISMCEYVSVLFALPTYIARHPVGAHAPHNKRKKGKRSAYCAQRWADAHTVDSHTEKRKSHKDSAYLRTYTEASKAQENFSA